MTDKEEAADAAMAAPASSMVAPIPVESPTDNTKPSKPPSEFNVRSVLVLIASACALFCTAGILNAYGDFQEYYTVHYLPGYTNFQIAWIGSFSIFMFFGFGVPAGIMADKYGPTLPLIIGTVCELLGVFMTSLCRKYYQFFLAQGVLWGFGLGFITVATTSVIPHYFQRNRGLAQGVTIAGSSLGGVIWPIALDRLLNKDQVGFGWTLRIVGFIMLPLLIIVIVGVRRPPVAKKSVEMGEGPITAENKAEEKAAKAKQRKEDLVRLRHPSFILLCLGLDIFYFGFFAPFFFITTYAVHLGISQGFAFYLLSILNAASFFGRILPGYIADRVGPFNVVLVAMFGSALVCFCWTAVTSVAGIVVFSLAYGFISGAVLSLQFACVARVATKETVGTAIGIVMASISFTGLFGTPICGELVKSGYVALSCFAGATMLVGGGLMTAARLSRDRRLWAIA